MHKTWKYFDYMIVVAGLVIAGLIWFIPNFTESKEYKDLVGKMLERRERRLEREAEAERIRVEREELGIVYFGPPAADGAAAAEPER
jgi:hypothetical protein